MSNDPANGKSSIRKIAHSVFRPRTRSQTALNRASSFSDFSLFQNRHIIKKSKNNDGSTESLVSSAGSDDERKRKLFNDMSTNTIVQVSPGGTQEAVKDATHNLENIDSAPSTQITDSQPTNPGTLSESQVIDAQVEAMNDTESIESFSSGCKTPTPKPNKLSPEMAANSQPVNHARFQSLTPEDKDFRTEIDQGLRCEQPTLDNMVSHYEDAMNLIRQVFTNRTNTDNSADNHRETMVYAQKFADMLYETSEAIQNNQVRAQDWLFENDALAEAPKDLPHSPENDNEDMETDEDPNGEGWDDIIAQQNRNTECPITDAHEFVNNGEPRSTPQALPTTAVNIPGLENNPIGNVLMAILARLDSLEGKNTTTQHIASPKPVNVPTNTPQVVESPPKVNTSNQRAGLAESKHVNPTNTTTTKPSFAQAAKKPVATPSMTKGPKIPEVNASKIANTLRRSNGPATNCKRFIVRFENMPMSQPTTETILRGLRETLNQDNFTMGGGNLTHTRWGMRGTLHLAFLAATTQPCIERAIATIVKRFKFPNYTYHTEEPWSKLVIKGVPTGLATDIPTTYSRDELTAELKLRLPTEHQNVKFALEPDWMTNPITLQNEQRPSGVVQFTIVDPGNNITEKLLKIGNFWMFGKRCHMAKFVTKPILQVCTNCAHYGHTANSCKQKKPRCNKCGGFDHTTANHKAANCKGCKIHGTEKREPCECVFCPSCRKRGHNFNTPECPKMSEFRAPIVDALNRSNMSHE